MSMTINKNVISDMIDIYKNTLENATKIGNKFAEDINEIAAEINKDEFYHLYDEVMVDIKENLESEVRKIARMTDGDINEDSIFEEINIQRVFKDSDLNLNEDEIRLLQTYAGAVYNDIACKWCAWQETENVQGGYNAEGNTESKVELIDKNVKNTLIEILNNYRNSLNNIFQSGIKLLKSKCKDDNIYDLMANLLEITQTTIDGVFEKGWDGSGVIEKCKEM